MGLLVLVTHVPLGRQVLDRGIVFMDLAVAQMATLGVLLGVRWGGHPSALETQAFALLAATLGSGLLLTLERRWPQQQEALIGVVFVLGASTSTLLVADRPQGAEHAQHLLTGQIVWVTGSDLLGLGVLTAWVAAWWRWSPWRHHRWSFYGTFALMITASVQAVGVYLVFASLIIPALSIRKAQLKRATLQAWLMGGLAYGIGLCIAVAMDWPSGPVIVWSLAGTGLLWAHWQNKKPPTVG